MGEYEGLTIKSHHSHPYHSSYDRTIRFPTDPVVGEKGGIELKRTEYKANTQDLTPPSRPKYGGDEYGRVLCTLLR